ncbi:hypothetical protein ACLOJK_026687 [Asimina triloba]
MKCLELVYSEFFVIVPKNPQSSSSSSEPLGSFFVVFVGAGGRRNSGAIVFIFVFVTSRRRHRLRRSRAEGDANVFIASGPSSSSQAGFRSASLPAPPNSPASTSVLRTFRSAYLRSTSAPFFHSRSAYLTGIYLCSASPVVARLALRLCLCLAPATGCLLACWLLLVDCCWLRLTASCCWLTAAGSG